MPKLQKKEKDTGAISNRTKKDLSMAAAFVGAVAVLLLVAGYVISRLARERAYEEKWKDYYDCGWA